MAEIKDLNKIVEKWVRVAPTRTTDYSEGIAAPRRDWGQAAAAAETTWSTAIQTAITQKRFSAGVKKAGTQKWQERAMELGTRRWPEGISVAKDDYSREFAPFYEEIKRTPLPPKYPKGDPRNIDRVKKIAEALHAKKIGMLATK
jgi:hypothetical protein